MAESRRYVSVDTGGPDDVFPDARVVWLHVPRGGYGFVLNVPARVVAHGRRPATWVRIVVERRDGRQVERRVDARSLRWPEVPRG